MDVRLIFFSIIPLLASAAPRLQYPDHASCKLTWTFNAQCTDVNEKMLTAMKSMGGSSGCDNGGEKCLYKIKQESETEIKGTHETPAKHYKDDLDIKLSQSGSVCTVSGYSTSETWYAYLDYGTNYCNLHNIVTTAGLDKADGYSEETSNSDCTQFSSADCSKY